ncbi:MAG: Holliday junction resolvase RuvX [Caldibacillus debilis]|jgi:putative Holliday junction resolvase|uniref:Putative pre-16S rRNA nuclease n=2 Tax=Caldibacillus debilis TaxID=301148 RepID=A0A420VC18_9BACI|nr:Holliday junction resolvase RuvX [Caldibacillus debilis]MBO2480887.1 Holliday junction resolvase RuvX [Bacillaceae bacterium]MBY6272983.1 Holliday junction resolvase RuvX [Bacillaceae bacterium]OUM86575.1 MAG: Holliday junction DNA helicase RuvA [Caldibacillus debilis]REJ19787.1 MAG: Holliday junction resolvase RuvX [Caldibacillus debilis]REJ27154.1 MAG: Holliday junction resolvase RuvX [Caldibacillus debilis]
MRIMGLDVGTKTVGVAVSDPFGWTAQGVETIAIDEEQDEYGWERLGKLIAEYQVDQIVIGFPKNMDGSTGPRAEAVRRYAAMAEERFHIPVILWDERLSTMAAERILLKADMSRKKRKKVIDKMAAVMILQNYLDSKKSRI